MGNGHAAYLVRLGNAGGVYTMITHAEDGDTAVPWVRHAAGKIALALTVAHEKDGYVLSAQETAFIAWCDKECEPTKVLAVSSWDGRFGDELPIFAPTGLAAWSLTQFKRVSGRVSRLEVSPAQLAMRCPVCDATYGAYWPDYSFHGRPEDYVFTCDCEETRPVMLFVAPNGEVVDDTGALAFMRQWYKENSL